MPPYHHTQFGWTAGFIVLVADTFAIVIVALAGAAWAALLVVGGSALVFLLFGWLTVHVDDERLRLRFGLGVVRRSWRLADITRAQTVRNPWYVGWGIRLLPRRTVFNVSGFDAVEFELRSGKIYRIGTDDAPALLAAVERDIGR